MRQRRVRRKWYLRPISFCFKWITNFSFTYQSIIVCGCVICGLIKNVLPSCQIEGEGNCWFPYGQWSLFCTECCALNDKTADFHWTAQPNKLWIYYFIPEYGEHRVYSKRDSYPITSLSRIVARVNYSRITTVFVENMYNNMLQKPLRPGSCKQNVEMSNNTSERWYKGLRSSVVYEAALYNDFEQYCRYNNYRFRMYSLRVDDIILYIVAYKKCNTT